MSFTLKEIPSPLNQSMPSKGNSDLVFRWFAPGTLCLSYHLEGVEWNSSLSRYNIFRRNQPVMVAHAFNPSSQQAEAERHLWVQGQHWSTQSELHSKTQSLNKRKNYRWYVRFCCYLVTSNELWMLETHSLHRWKQRGIFIVGEPWTLQVLLTIEKNSSWFDVEIFESRRQNPLEGQWWSFTSNGKLLSLFPVVPMWDQLLILLTACQQ